MSWSMWHVYGKGFKVDSLDGEKLLEFMENHKESLDDGYKQMLEDLKLTEYPIDLDEDVRQYTDFCTVSEIIAYVMRRETKIGFEHCGISDDNEDAVIFCACYPWQMNDAERELTSEKLKEISLKYMKELDIPESEYDYLDFVFSG